MLGSNREEIGYSDASPSKNVTRVDLRHVNQTLHYLFVTSERFQYFSITCSEGTVVVGVAHPTKIPMICTVITGRWTP